MIMHRQKYVRTKTYTCTSYSLLFLFPACTMPEDLFTSRYDKSIQRLVVNVTCPTGVGSSYEFPNIMTFAFEPISSRTVRSNESTMYVLVFNTTGSWRQENVTKFHLVSVQYTCIDILMSNTRF